MHVFRVLRKSLLGLGLVVGLWQTAAATTTYTGSYSARASVDAPFSEQGTVTFKVEDDGTLNCTVESLTGMGSFVGTGKFRQATDSVGKPIKGRVSMDCRRQAFPQYIDMYGNNEKDAEALSGIILLRSSTTTVSMVGTFSASLTPVINGGDTLPQVPLAPQGITGLWYDPASNGTGFNFIAADNGFFATYYGRSASSLPLWLISTEVPTGTLKTNVKYTTTLGATTAGSFTQPAYQVETWGTLDITFSSCGLAMATLSGKDGTQQFNLQRLTTIGGVGGCQ